MQPESTGITLELSADVADDLRRRKVLPTLGEWDVVYEQPADVVDDHISENDHPDSDDGDESVLSDTPPSTLPLIAVDCVKFLGFQPESEEERHAIRDQVQQALWNDDDFDGKIADMFETGVAWHARECLADDVTINYPEMFVEGVSTAQTWKRLLRSHRTPVVDRVLRHLVQCNRSLLWKDAMRTELVRLASEEERQKSARVHEQELREWQLGRRKDSLQQLYAVRETLEHQLQVAKKNLELLEVEREELVATEVERLRVEEGVSVGLTSFDLNVMQEGSPFDFLGRQFAGDQEDEYDQKLATAEREEQQIRDRVTSPSWKLSASLVQSLEARVEQVDSMLESLQEEEWEAEEEGEDQPKESTAEPERGLSLLDQVLAMILGSLGRSPDFAWLQSEHQEIVEEWTSHFGRLPPNKEDEPRMEPTTIHEDESNLVQDLAQLAKPDNEWDDSDSD